VPKTPAIERFLKKKCPKTVAEFKQRYGSSRIEKIGKAAQEYSLWDMNGAPVRDVNCLMIYPNVIKDQFLYVYARDGNITHIAVVERTQWRKGDFRPSEGQRIMW